MRRPVTNILQQPTNYYHFCEIAFFCGKFRVVKLGVVWQRFYQVKQTSLRWYFGRWPPSPSPQVIIWSLDHFNPMASKNTLLSWWPQHECIVMMCLLSLSHRRRKCVFSLTKSTSLLRWSWRSPPPFQSNFKETAVKTQDNCLFRYLHRYSVEHVTTFICFNRSGKDIKLSSISHVTFLISLRLSLPSLGRRFSSVEQINYNSGCHIMLT
jgi:hypothetical protein